MIRTFACSLLLLPLCGCHDAPAAPARAATPSLPDVLQIPADSPELRELTVATAELGKAPPRRGNGRLVWAEDRTARVFAPLGGRVVAIHVDLGQTVAAGQPLATVSSPEFGQATAALRRARAEQAFAERTAQRLTELLQQGAVARRDVLVAEVELARATAELDRSAAQVAAYGAGDDCLDQTLVIRAPIAGVVVERNLTPGQEVRPDQMLAGLPQVAAPLVTISDPNQLWILIDATEADAEHYQPGDPLLVFAPSAPKRHGTGSVQLVADAVDPNTRMVRVRGTVDNRARQLRAEMFVTTETSQPEAASVQVPSRAVFLAGERHYLFVERGPGWFQRRQVHLGGSHDDRLLIADGLAAGERVVAKGGTLLEQLYQTRN
jgi:cobalt-zinc-cadmium efflux system membrane fusion protein